MITVKRLTLEDARIILEAAEVKAKEIGVAETICVCDDGGHPIALHRMTGARITGVEIAIAKAFTAAGHRRATHKFNAPPGGPALPGNEAFGIHAMHPGKFAIFVGGFPIEVEGEVVGGIGVSGGSGALRGRLRGRARLRSARLRRRLLERHPLGAGLRADGEPLALHRRARRRQPGGDGRRRRVAAGLARIIRELLPHPHPTLSLPRERGP